MNKKQLKQKSKTEAQINKGKRAIKQTASNSPIKDRKANFIHIFSVTLLGLILLFNALFLIYSQINRIEHPYYYYISFSVLVFGFAGLAKMDMMVGFVNRVANQVVGIIIKKFSDESFSQNDSMSQGTNSESYDDENIPPVELDDKVAEEVSNQLPTTLDENIDSAEEAESIW